MGIDMVKLGRLMVAFLRRYGVEEAGEVTRIDLNRSADAMPSDAALSAWLMSCKNIGEQRADAIIHGKSTQRMVIAGSELYTKAKTLLPEDLKSVLEPDPDKLEKEMAARYPEAHDNYARQMMTMGQKKSNKPFAAQVAHNSNHSDLASAMERVRDGNCMGPKTAGGTWRR